MHFIPANEQVVIQPGWTVWISGADFASGIHGCSHTRRQSLSMLRWGRLALRGLHWRSGPREAFAEFIAGLEVELRAALYTALFDREEVTHGEAAIIHDLYRVLPLRERLDRSVASGVYYFEIRDTARYEFTRRAAIAVYRLFENESAYDTAVEQKREDLRRARLREARAPSADMDLLRSNVALMLINRWARGAESRLAPHDWSGLFRLAPGDAWSGFGEAWSGFDEIVGASGLKRRAGESVVDDVGST